MNSHHLMCAAASYTLLAALAAQSHAAVPADIESQLVAIGRIVDPACTAKLYRPLMPVNDVASDVKPLYPGVDITRDLSFGSNPKDVIDVFVGDKGPPSRAVLIYVPGGSGEKIEIQDREANAFYDNIGRWATKHGMVGVTMQRHAGAAWDDGAKDIAHLIGFLQTNIAKYHGNADRMFIWAHSAGNIPLGTYLGHPELWGPKGLGVKGAVFISPAPFDIAPLKADLGSPQDMMKMFALAGKTCDAGGPASTAGALPGKKAGEPGGPPTQPMTAPGAPPPGAPPPGAPAPQDPATQLARSSFPALKSSPAKIMLVNGDLDMWTEGASGGVQPFVRVLHDELCKQGPNHCPTLLVAQGHSHMSLVFSIDTADTSVSGPILSWMQMID